MPDRSVPSPFLSARSAVAFVHDVAMAAASFVLALHLRLGDRMLDYLGDSLLPGTAIFAAIAAAVFWAVGLYRGVWRYASMNDLLAIARGVTLTILVFLPVMFMLSRLEGVPRSALAINWLVLIFLLGAPRFVYRILKDGGLAHVLERGNGLRVPVLLVGAGDAAELFIREMARDRTAPFQVAGILDMDGRRVGQRIHGVPVLGGAMRAIHMVETDRDAGPMAHREINEQVTRVVAEGLSLVIYPEGTRSTNAEIMPFKKGAFRIAIDNAMPMVPVTITGSERVWKPAAKLIFGGRVRLVIHDPIPTKGLNAAADIGDLRDRVRSMVEETYAEIRIR